MSIKTDIEQLVTDAAKVHSWSNGNATHSEPFGALNVRSPAKLIADKDEQINVAANGLLAQTTAAAANATIQAANAANLASIVVSQALTASAQANVSTAKAGEAAASAASSLTSASASAASAASAAASLVSVNNIFDSFDDRYLGAKATAPTLDNDGNALLAGTVYFNTTSSTIWFYNGAAWEAPTAAAATSANNAMNSQNAAASSAAAAAGSAASSAGSAATAATTLSAAQAQAVRAADWAEKISATVDGTGYSAKHWAGQAAGSAAAVTSNTVIPADVFTATVGQTDFTISRAISYPGAILVIVAGVPQAPIDAYTVLNSTTLRFSSGLAAGVGISVRYLDKEAQSGAAVAQEWASKTGGTVSGSTEYSAKTHAQNASASATNSASSAAASANSATAATTSASTASSRATEASTSAADAAGSASTATTKASEASTSAVNAASSASAAAGSASSASGSASSANTKASEAAGSAATASTKATESSSSASSSAGSASAANTSASQASSSASSASGSASTATSAASNAQTYATQAQAAAASASGSNVTPQVFAGNGSTVDFALATASGSVHKLMVTVGNVVQDSLDSYSLVNSGATLRFSAAPYNGSRIVVRYL